VCGHPSSRRYYCATPQYLRCTKNSLTYTKTHSPHLFRHRVCCLRPASFALAEVCVCMCVCVREGGREGERVYMNYRSVHRCWYACVRFMLVCVREREKERYFLSVLCVCMPIDGSDDDRQMDRRCTVYNCSVPHITTMQYLPRHRHLQQLHRETFYLLACTQILSNKNGTRERQAALSIRRLCL